MGGYGSCLIVMALYVLTVDSIYRHRTQRDGRMTESKTIEPQIDLISYEHYEHLKALHLRSSDLHAMTVMMKMSTTRHD